METHESTNLFQQIGTIQGTLTALISNLNNFQIEFRASTNEQNRKIEESRKEVAREMESLSRKVEGLELFKANYDGAQTVILRSAQWRSAIISIVISAIIGLGVNFIQHIYKF